MSEPMNPSVEAIRDVLYERMTSTSMPTELAQAIMEDWGQRLVSENAALRERVEALEQALELWLEWASTPSFGAKAFRQKHDISDDTATLYQLCERASAALAAHEPQGGSTDG